MKENQPNENQPLEKKKLIIIIASAVVAVAAIVVVLILVLGGKKEAYRLIKVYEMDGDATITRADVGEVSAYDNMVLMSGDEVVMNQGRMTLQLDEDKYIYVEEGAELRLEATGTAENSKTTITLAKGEITNDIQNKLSGDSYYEVNTPNATMSVRGTVFYVNVYEGPDGVLYTKVCVFEGSVETNLIYEDGTVAEESKIVGVDDGNQVIIYEDDVTTDYLTEVEAIDYEDLPEELITTVDAILAERGEEAISNNVQGSTSGEEEPVIEEPGPFTVTFYYGDQVFGSQVIEKGSQVTEPRLMPEASGHWDYDFSTAVTADVEIHWVSN